MALEDLTGTKYISSLVPGNPVSADDRREGDDHIRGVKNVLLNTFPNINGAVTVTDEQLNAVLTTALGLLKANNLSDVADAFTSRVNLGVHDANGKFTITPLTTGNALLALAAMPGGAVNLTTINTSDVASSVALVAIGVGGPLAGDPQLLFDVSGALAWSVGMDNSDADAFKVSVGAALGTNDVLRLVNTGATCYVTMTLKPPASECLRLLGASAFLAGYDDPGTTRQGYLQFTASVAILNSDAGGLNLSVGGTPALQISAAGVVTAPTPSASDDSTKVATTTWVHAEEFASIWCTYTSPSRTWATTYTNSTRRPLLAQPNVVWAGDSYQVTATVGGATVANITQSAGGVQLSLVVPPGYTYRIDRSGSGAVPSLTAWTELV